MIIHSIHANNVLKYQQLDLQDLPQQGIIAISGFNESGKSTIAETICFALFGRTFSINDDDLHKIIHWGASNCKVTIEFSNNKTANNNDERYAITRMLDCDGNHSAKLYKVYNEENPIARGIERVDEALFDLTSIEFDEFIESFYLAQREITTPHPHSYALKTMAGIATMEYCDHGIDEDIEKNNDLITDLQKRQVQLQEELDELELDPDTLQKLTDQHNSAVQNKAEIETAQSDYQSALDDYNEANPKLKSYIKKKGRASFWRFSYFLLAAGAFALWWILVKMPDVAIHEQLSQLLQNNLPQITPQHYHYLLYIGGGVTFLFLIYWAARISHNGNIKRLHQAGSILAEKMQTLDDTNYPEEINLIAQSKASEQQLSEVSVAHLSYFSQQHEHYSQEVEQVSEALSIERNRVQQAQELVERISDISAQINEKQARNKVRETAQELLSGATRHLSKRFNHILREHVGKTLPLFTDGRYEHLQIDDDLSVRVFSSEKHDFMDLDEISSGTQRQIMLAVRLALSQEMVSRKVQNQQFLILDEPFAFFDQERTERSLNVLPQLSNDMPQIWVITQAFPENMEFAQSIYCNRDSVIKTS